MTSITLIVAHLTIVIGQIRKRLNQQYENLKGKINKQNKKSWIDESYKLYPRAS